MPNLSPTDGRWILNRGMLSSPCDRGGCKRHIEPGEYYWRMWRGLGLLFCRDCAPFPFSKPATRPSP